MVSGSSRDRRSAEDDSLDLRQRLSVDIRIRFARFGDEVLGTVLAYAMVPKRMPALLTRLGIRTHGSMEDQIEAVWNFAADHGTWEFLRRARAEIRNKNDIPKLDDVGDAILMAQAADGADIEVPRVIHAPPPPAKREAPPEPEPAPDATPQPEPEEPEADDRDPSLPPPMPGTVECAAYTGPERRSGVERRSGKDRRLEVSAVGANQRFGKDRRKRPHGRREIDIPKT